MKVISTAALLLSRNSRTTDSRGAANSAEFFFPLMPRRTACALICAVGLMFPVAFAADPANMTGVWLLNVEESKWGKKPPPESVSLRIEHNEPALKYWGEVVDAKGNESKFEFDGALDGKEYPAKESGIDGKIVYKRLSPTVVSSTLTSGDGKIVEETVTTMTKDGKTMVRKIRHEGPDGKRTWTEVYKKS
ncbi:MAG: hypothetical protein ACRD7E_16350 [Bryobacteraceae bacterium]